MFKNDTPERSLSASQTYQMLSFSCLNFHPEGTSLNSEKINTQCSSIWSYQTPKWNNQCDRLPRHCNSIWKQGLPDLT